MHDNTLPPNHESVGEPTDRLMGLTQMDVIQPDHLIGLKPLERQTVAARLFQKCSPMTAVALLSDEHGVVKASATLSMMPMLFDRTQPPARMLAYQLAMRDVSVLSISEPNDLEDGMIVINDRVHVKVPHSPGAPGVVTDSLDGTLTFRPSTHNLQQLIAAIHEGIGANAS